MEAESLPPAAGQAPLGEQIINVALQSIMRGLAAQPSINNDKCFTKVAGEALPDPLKAGHAQIKIIIL
jgi:xanthosine utilization system XapX-like protein